MQKVDQSDRTTRILDESAEVFTHDDDTTDALDMFHRGFLTQEDLGHRLRFLSEMAKDRVRREYAGPCEPDDSLARPGTWDRQAGFPVIRRRWGA